MPLTVGDTWIDDLYVRGLAAGFPMLTDAAARRSPSCTTTSSDLLPVARSDSSLWGVATALQQRIPDICQRNPDVVYFGG